MKKTIQDIEEMALLYMEEAIFGFEKILAHSHETRSEDSEIISRLTGYEAYISHMDENGSSDDYSYLHEEIDTFIMRYDKCSSNDIDRESNYYRELETRIAQGKFKGFNQMYRLYFVRGVYDYKVLDANIDSFDISHGFSEYNNYRAFTKKINTEILVQAIQDYRHDESPTIQKSVNGLVHNKNFYNGLKLIPMSKENDDKPSKSTLNGYYSEYMQSNK